MTTPYVASMARLETPRLALRELTAEDAGFILQLLNEPSFIRHIGDRGVRTVEDARNYILNGPMESYRRHGFGLYLVELKADGQPIGICGLLKRDALEHADIGFALLPPFWRRGYAREAATAVLAQARASGMARVLAITSLDNVASIDLLAKLGFRFDRLARIHQDEPDLKVFTVAL